MTANGLLQIAVFCAFVTVTAIPLGNYMARVFGGERTFLSPVLGPVERAIYWASGIDPKKEQHWLTYVLAVLLFHIFCFVSLYALMRLQYFLPFNPQGMTGVEPTLSYFTQMAGLTVHNFVSAAAGIVVVIALIRGFIRRSAQTIGNFWVDLTRCCLYILLPFSIVLTLILVWQGMPQNLGGYVDATTLEGTKQTIAQGPVASQIVIKTVGTNGGGFFNTNAAHPYENPNAFTNLLTMWMEFLIGAALVFTFGKMVGNMRQGWALYGVMGILFLCGTLTAYWAEGNGNPAFAKLGVDQSYSQLQAGGNMEGKEIRFGITDSAMFATTTTDTSTGAVNSMHD